jgi:hypothetical protein
MPGNAEYCWANQGLKQQYSIAHLSINYGYEIYRREVMDDLVELLYEIRKKPLLYFGGRKTLAHLEHFICGFVTGREGTNKEIDESTNWFSPSIGAFQSFVVKKYQITISQSWCNIIEFHTSSENEAFNLFFNLLDEFLGK